MSDPNQPGGKPPWATGGATDPNVVAPAEDFASTALGRPTFEDATNPLDGPPTAVGATPGPPPIVGGAQAEREECLLALDVEIEGRLRDSDRLGHVGHLGAPVALRDEHASRACEQILKAALRYGPRHVRNYK